MRRLFQDVYVPAGTSDTHQLRCEGAALILPPEAVITGRSAATVRGVALARASDPIEVLLPEIIQVNRRTGIDVRRTKTCAEDREPWGEIGLTIPLRMGLDLLLDRTLPDAVANLDAVLRAGLVDRAELRRMLSQRRDHGIVLARQAEELADPRANHLRNPGCECGSYATACIQYRSTGSRTPGVDWRVQTLHSLSSKWRRIRWILARRRTVGAEPGP